MADLMQALMGTAGLQPGCTAEADDELISATDVRVMIGVAPTYPLHSLAGCPLPVRRAECGRHGRPALYRRSDIEQWYAARGRKEADRIARRRAKDEAARRERDAFHTTSHAPSLVGLPTEHARTLSLRRDLFDEDPLTCAPVPCSRWAVLLRKAGASADGRDISPAMLAAERRGDGRVARAAVTVGHHPDVVKPRAGNPRFLALTQNAPQLTGPTAVWVVQDGR